MPAEGLVHISSLQDDYYRYDRGTHTLAVRVAAQTASAARVADALAEMPGIGRVLYPGRPDHPQYALAQRQMKGGSTLIASGVASKSAATASSPAGKASNSSVASASARPSSFGGA